MEKTNNEKLEQMSLDALTDFELEQYRKKMGYKLGWIARQMVRRYGDKGLTRYQVMRGFKPAWVTRQRQIMVESHKKSNL